MDTSNYWDDFEARVKLTKDAITEGQMPSLKRLTVHLTEGCNLNCVYCNMKLRKKEIRVVLVERIIREFVEMGGSIIHFTGGEPTIVPYFEWICEYAKKRGLTVSANTNAVKGVSVRNIDKLKASFDTCDRNAFNAMVGRDAFDKVVANLKRYSGEMQDKMLSITAVLNRQTYCEMMDLAKFCYDNFALYNLYFSNYKGDDSRFSFSERDIDLMFKVHIPEVIDFFDATGQAHSAKQLRLYSRKDFANGERFSENYVTPCYIQLSEMVIDVDGECHNCSHLFRDGVKGSGHNINGRNLQDCFVKMKAGLKKKYCFLSEKCTTGCNPNLIGYNTAVAKALAT